jgi:hypothetical protein
MRNLIVIFLLIPLIVVLVAKDPQGAGHLFEMTVTAGAKLLNAVATAISAMISG